MVIGVLVMGDWYVSKNLTSRYSDSAQFRPKVKPHLKYGKTLSTEEMNDLVDKLFACKMPYYSPNGKPVIIKLSLEDLEKKFQK